jgi:plastocyanin
MKRIATSLVAAAAVLGMAAGAHAYDAMAVTDGGTIIGTIKYTGAAPAEKTIKPNKDVEVCGSDLPNEALEVGADKGLKNAVVRLTDIKKGKKLEAKATVDQQKCRFTPHVTVAPVGQDVSILNSDGILHNIHTYSTANPSMNVAQPKFKKEVKAKFAKPEIIKLSCDVHNWMQGWIVATDHPYVAVTDEKGAFKLTDVPPGTYKVEIWHETGGKQEKTVTVTAKGEAKLDAELSGK